MRCRCLIKPCTTVDAAHALIPSHPPRLLSDPPRRAAAARPSHVHAAAAARCPAPGGGACSPPDLHSSGERGGVFSRGYSPFHPGLPYLLWAEVPSLAFKEASTEPACIPCLHLPASSFAVCPHSLPPIPLSVSRWHRPLSLCCHWTCAPRNRPSLRSPVGTKAAVCP